MRIHKISFISLIAALCSSVTVDAAVRTNNTKRSYADAYQQVNNIRYQQDYMNANTLTATTASATPDLPVEIEDKNLENAIIKNESDTTLSMLDACAMIYPGGVFKWGIPESGIRKNQVPQCIAVVNLIDATTNEILATTTVAAGDTMKCNVDYFPANSFSANLRMGKVEVPADNPPTMADVESVMNKEQKQNAGIKIATGAILGGLAGNLLAPKEAGSGKGSVSFGTGKTQIVDTVIGTATGAGIMAASTYSGKVAGDTIKSTTVNAASGMLVGNMMAGANASNTVLATTKCRPENDSEKDCIVGNIYETGTIYKSKGDTIYLVHRTNGTIKKCNSDLSDCSDEYLSLTNIVLESDSGDIHYDKIKDTDVGYLKLYLQDESDTKKLKSTINVNHNDLYFKIKSADEVKNQKHAYAVFSDGTLNKPFGYTKDDWDKNLNKNAVYYARNSDGSVGRQITDTKNIKFVPSGRSASDGGLIDLSNEARAKGTIIGTAAGGAMGGFAGYQGAKSELTERWVTAVQEYKDSLSNFGCSTGQRFLSTYNDYLEIPELKTEK